MILNNNNHTIQGEQVTQRTACSSLESLIAYLSKSKSDNAYLIRFLLQKIFYKIVSVCSGS